MIAGQPFLVFFGGGGAVAWLVDWEAWGAIMDALDRVKCYPWVRSYKSSKLLQKVIWRLLRVVYLKLKGLLVTIYVDLLIFSSP